MKAVNNVLPEHPEILEVVLAKDQKMYKPLPVACVEYSDGVKSMISRYRLGWWERVRLLFHGDLWLEQMTFGQQLQPQRPTVFEPLTEADREAK